MVKTRAWRGLDALLATIFRIDGAALLHLSTALLQPGK